MTDTNDKVKKETLKVANPGRLSLTKTVESGKVKQNFTHGRSKTVTVEVTPEQAEKVVTEGLADAVLVAREFLRDPYWPLHVATQLGIDVQWPRQYQRAKPNR